MNLPRLYHLECRCDDRGAHGPQRRRVGAQVPVEDGAEDAAQGVVRDLGGGGRDMGGEGRK